MLLKLHVHVGQLYKCTYIYLFWRMILIFIYKSSRQNYLNFLLMSLSQENPLILVEVNGLIKSIWYLNISLKMYVFLEHSMCISVSFTTNFSLLFLCRLNSCHVVCIVALSRTEIVDMPKTEKQKPQKSFKNVCPSYITLYFTRLTQLIYELAECVLFLKIKKNSTVLSWVKYMNISRMLCHRLNKPLLFSLKIIVMRSIFHQA